MKNFLYNISRSSIDPTAMSLTVKAFLVGLVPTIMAVAPIVCQFVSVLCFDLALINPAIDGIVKFVESLLYVVAGIMFVIGLFRKVRLGRWSAPK